MPAASFILCGVPFRLPPPALPTKLPLKLTAPLKGELGGEGVSVSVMLEPCKLDRSSVFMELFDLKLMSCAEERFATTDAAA